MTLLRKDEEAIRSSPEFKELNLEVTTSDKTPLWHFVIRGQARTFWAEQEYDIEIRFSRRHPFEAPTVVLPPTDRNRRSIKAPLEMLHNGVVRLHELNSDVWTCTTSAIDVIRVIRSYFERAPSAGVRESHSLPINARATSSLSSAFSAGDSLVDVLPDSLLQRILHYMSLTDIAQFSQCSTTCLLVAQQDDFWAQAFYERSRLSYMYSNIMDNCGPLRVYNPGYVVDGWHWEESREAFIRAYECVLYGGDMTHMGEHAYGEQIPVLLSLLHGLEDTLGTRIEDTFDSEGLVRAQLRVKTRRLARLCRWFQGTQGALHAVNRGTRQCPMKLMRSLATLFSKTDHNIMPQRFFAEHLNRVEARLKKPYGDRCVKMMSLLTFEMSSKPRSAATLLQQCTFENELANQVDVPGAPVLAKSIPCGPPVPTGGFPQALGPFMNNGQFFLETVPNVNGVLNPNAMNFNHFNPLNVPAAPGPPVVLNPMGAPMPPFPLQGPAPLSALAPGFALLADADPGPFGEGPVLPVGAEIAAGDNAVVVDAAEQGVLEAALEAHVDAGADATGTDMISAVANAGATGDEDENEDGHGDGDGDGDVVAFASLIPEYSDLTEGSYAAAIEAPAVLPSFSELLEAFADDHSYLSIMDPEYQSGPLAALNNIFMLDCCDSTGAWMPAVTKPANWLYSQLDITTKDGEIISAKMVDPVVPTPPVPPPPPSSWSSSSLSSLSPAVAEQSGPNAHDGLSNWVPHIHLEYAGHDRARKVLLQSRIANDPRGGGQQTVATETIKMQRACGLPQVPLVTAVWVNRSRAMLAQEFKNMCDMVNVDRSWQASYRMMQESSEASPVPKGEPNPDTYRECLRRPFETISRNYLAASTSECARIAVHFIGHKPCYDECYRRGSPRMAPFRTRTQRAKLSSMDVVEGILKSVGVDTHPRRHASAIQVRMRCLWLSGSPGAGMVRYCVPRQVKLRDMLIDVCSVLKLPRCRCSLVLCDMVSAVCAIRAQNGCDDKRLPKRHHQLEYTEDTLPSLRQAIRPLSLNETVEQAGVEDGDTVDIILRPPSGAQGGDECLGLGKYSFAQG